jgi:hypothetical protein
MPSYRVEFSGLIVAASQEDADELANRIVAEAPAFLPRHGAQLATMAVEVVIPKRERVAA